MTLTAFEKRVRRRITGRDHDFFVVCSPGLRTLCRKEMTALGIPGDRMEIMDGGIGFTGRIQECAALNLTLRSPSRILLRVTRFRADSFDRLEKKIRAVDWPLFLPRNTPLHFTVHTRKSRLYHSDAVARRCEALIRDQLLSHPEAGQAIQAPEKSGQTIHVRADQDEFLISLDSSGDLLFKRGLKKTVTAAPLRENLAFAVLTWAGFTPSDILLDPMCGSGTFSLEAAMIKAHLPPGLFRSFALENWPAFSPKAFAHLRKQAEDARVRVSEKQIFASDTDIRAVDAMSRNLSGHDFCRSIELSCRDFFSLDPALIRPGQKGVIVLNPPYGRRLDGETGTRRFYRELENKLATDFKGWRLGLIFPSKASASQSRLRLQHRPIFHGGLEAVVAFGLI